MFKDTETKNKMIDDEDLKAVIAKEEYTKGKKQLQKLETSRFSMQKRWLIAASFIVLLGVLSFWVLDKDVTPKELFAQNFETYPNLIAPKTRSENIDTIKEITFKNYESKKFKEAIKGFNSLLTIKNIDTTAIKLYKAVSLLSIDKTKEAIVILANNKNVNKAWKDKYVWYLSLAYLKENKKEQAIESLKKLSKTTHNFKKSETLSLLKKLE